MPLAVSLAMIPAVDLVGETDETDDERLPTASDGQTITARRRWFHVVKFVFSTRLPCVHPSRLVI